MQSSDIVLIHSLGGVVRTTEFGLFERRDVLDGREDFGKAHGTATFMFDVEDVAGIWNVVLVFRRGDRNLEIARVSDISGRSIHMLLPSHWFSYGRPAIPEPTNVRYFTQSDNARLSGTLMGIYGN